MDAHKRQRTLVAVSLTALALGAVAVVARSQSKAEEACVAKSQVFALGFEGCFEVGASTGIDHKCDAHNYWKPRGACARSKAQTGTKFVRNNFDSLCSGAGGYYSPTFEGCMSGTYQRCEADGTWRTVGAPDGVSCK